MNEKVESENAVLCKCTYTHSCITTVGPDKYAMFLELEEAYVARFIVAVTKLHASRPREDFTPPPPPLYRAARSQQHSAASLAALRVMSCLHSWAPPNVVRSFCDLEACNLVTATAVLTGVLFWSVRS
jgi:hypothetical protein